jgi:hypothetical protein
MVERFSGEPLEQHRVGLHELLPVPAFHGELLATPLTLLPTAIARTPFARYARAETAASAYETLQGAREQILDFVRHAQRPTFTHWYVPDVDTACHHHGLGGEPVTMLLLELDAVLEQLAGRLPSGTRLVISADHGLIEVPAHGHLALAAEDRIMTLLQAPPSGDGRMPILHARPGCGPELERCFDEQFGSGFALLTGQECDELRLFGPEPMSSVSRQRFGDYVGIALGPVSLHYGSRASSKPEHLYVAQHAGLTPDELLVPLIVA